MSIYITLIAVFTTLNYYVAVAGGLDFGTTGKQNTLVAAFSYTATHATLGSSLTTPQSEWAILGTFALRLFVIALLLVSVHSYTRANIDPITESKALANATST